MTQGREQGGGAPVREPKEGGECHECDDPGDQELEREVKAANNCVLSRSVARLV